MVSKKLGEEWRGWAWSLFKVNGLYLGSVLWCGHECWSLWQGGEGGSVAVFVKEGGGVMFRGSAPLYKACWSLLFFLFFFYLYMKFFALAGFIRSAASFSPFFFFFLLHEWRWSLNQLFVPVSHLSCYARCDRSLSTAYLLKTASVAAHLLFLCCVQQFLNQPQHNPDDIKY